MSKYSRTYKVGAKRFRYNYDERMLEYVTPAAQVEKWISEADDEDKDFWRKEFKIIDGYTINDSTGLCLENWKESPRYWCEQYAYEIDEECAYAWADIEREMALYGAKEA